MYVCILLHFRLDLSELIKPVIANSAEILLPTNILRRSEILDLQVNSGSTYKIVFDAYY